MTPRRGIVGMSRLHRLFMNHSPAPRGRLAPSPTGHLHLGNAYAFLMAWLSVRSRGGTIVLRMEDIDPDRARPAFVEGIYQDLDWLGLTCDESPLLGGPYAPYSQSGRLDRYDSLLDRFQREGLVYPCYCSRKELRMLASAPHVGDEGAPYQGACRSLDDATRRAYEAAGRRPSLRLNTEAAVLYRAGAPGGILQDPAPVERGTSTAFDNSTGIGVFAFTDVVLGDRQGTLRDCGGDFALRRSDGVVAYQLAVVADDAAMGITEVVRGDDLLPSTPRQLLLFRLLGHRPPAYAHVPLLHDASGERLAKRHKSLTLAAPCARRGPRPKALSGTSAGWQGFLNGPFQRCPEICCRLFRSALYGAECSNCRKTRSNAFSACADFFLSPPIKEPS